MCVKLAGNFLLSIEMLLWSSVEMVIEAINTLIGVGNIQNSKFSIILLGSVFLSSYIGA